MVNYANPVHSKYFNGQLYQQMTDDLHLAGMSQRTVHGYLRSVRQLADFSRRSPDKVTESQLRRFFLHLKNEQPVRLWLSACRLLRDQVLLHPNLQTELGDLGHDEAAKRQDASRGAHDQAGSSDHQCGSC